MNKRAKVEDDQVETGSACKPKVDSRLLETFNHALSSIICHRKKSDALPQEMQDSGPTNKKKPRPVVWFPDQAVRDSPETKLEFCGKITSDIPSDIPRPVKKNSQFNEYQEWLDGSVKFRYPLSSREAQSHSSGWAMKYTNNHNKYVLKKTCVGVLLCSENCTLKDGSKVMIRPAISDKVRDRQLGQPCPNSECRNGVIVHRKCTGNNGYPVTHFWVHHMDCIQFEAKGKHDHPRPEAKRTAIRKRDAPPKYGSSVVDNSFYTPQMCHNKNELREFTCCPPPPDTKTFPRYFAVHGDCIKSCDITRGNEYVCFATPQMRDMAQDTLSKEKGTMNFSKAYVLCRTLPNYIHGFDLLESRIMSCASPECPLVLITLYRSGTLDGVLEHIRHLTVMCSPCVQKIRVPKWHVLVHDFPRHLQNLVVETIVNLMVDTQMQTLLREFQYKSVSSLYKMLRQKMMGSLRTFEEHFAICKYELLLRIRDPILVSSSEEVFSHLQSHYYTAKQFLNTDALIKDGVFGSNVREFWRFWGSDVISPAVFPAAKIVYAPIMRNYSYCSPRGCQGSICIQDAFVSLIDRLEKRGHIFSTTNVWIHPYQKRPTEATSDCFSQVPPQSIAKSHKMPVILSCGSYYGKQISPYVTPEGKRHR